MTETTPTTEIDQEVPAKGVGTTDAPDTRTPDAPTEQGEQAAAKEPETFTREYVEKLRKESADHRVRAKDRDDLAKQLFHARVAALGRLADPDDLPFDEQLLNDMPALEAAVDDLLGRKPHLASRQPRGDIGQGVGSTSENVDLAAILRAGAN